jgi:replicative DNA helicase
MERMMTLEMYNLADEFSDPNLELGLLAALSANQNAYFDVIDLLSTETFATHHSLFEGIATAIEDQQVAPTVVSTPVADPKAAASKLADLYQRRLIAILLQEKLEKLRSDIAAKDLSQEIEQGITQVQHAVREHRAGKLTSAPDLFADLVKTARERHALLNSENGQTVHGISTGYPTLDRLIGGLQPGLILLAGEPGVGKTRFALSCGVRAARAGVPTMFISFEEPLAKTAGLCLSNISGLPYTRYIDGYGNPDELEAAARTHSFSLERLFLLEGSAHLTIAQIKAKALQIMRRCGSDRVLIILDYLQRYAAAQREFTEYRHVVATLANDLRALSLRLSCPMLVISSQNRNTQGSVGLNSLKESGDLEYAAEGVFLMTENKAQFAEPPGRYVELHLVKNRFGDRAKVDLIFKPDTGSFNEVNSGEGS